MKIQIYYSQGLEGQYIPYSSIMWIINALFLLWKLLFFFFQEAQLPFGSTQIKETAQGLKGNASKNYHGM